ncbi:uncharacterized protein TNCT_161151 [Trichonephila clavata]|uniref:Uncharacterized protein n=1 Tax=Trichonephila clavata TaxID=2740835 RepID=A0A8X6GTU7_TRICU|nr:uncharacterized protein TNCT_161151 [Trichonephila clavata]
MKVLTNSLLEKIMYAEGEAEAYRAQTMPDLFEEPRRAIYSQPRKCESIYGQDYTWKEDYRPKGKFPGWCLKGDPPHFADCDKD